MPSPEQTRKIKNRFEIILFPSHSIKEDGSGGPRHGPQQQDDTTLLCTDGLQTNDTKNLNGIMDGQKNTVDTWTILQLLKYHTLQPGQNE